MNHYETLGLKQSATADEIRRAYRKLAARTHPDTGGEVMKPLFLAVQRAYEALSDEDSRAAYDRILDGPPEKEQASDDEPDQGTPRTGPEPAAEEVAENRTWQERADTLTEKRRKRLLTDWPMAAGLFAVWFVTGIYLSGRESPAEFLAEAGTPEVSASLVYTAAWAAAACHALVREYRGRTALYAPAAALALGLLLAPGFHATEPLPALVRAAAGFVLSVLAVIVARRRRTLAGLDRTGRRALRHAAFEHPQPQDDNARSGLLSGLADVLPVPGMRLLENVAIRGRVVPFVLVNGRRAAVIDVCRVPAWSMPGLSGNLASDFARIRHELETSLPADVAAVGQIAAETAGWLIVLPYRNGVLELAGTAKTVLRAGPPAAVFDEVATWLVEGESAGKVDGQLLYRLVSSIR